MKEFKSLQLLDKLKFLFVKLEIDYQQLRKILQLKLTVASRANSRGLGSSNPDQERNFWTKTLLNYGIPGGLIVIFFVSPLDLFIRLSICLAMIMFMIMTTIINDFSSILLDTKDKDILLGRPIGLRTLNLARLLHITIYLLIITGVIAGPTLVAGTIEYGILFIVLLVVDLLFALGFMVFATSLLYGLILKFFNQEKLKDAINYVQIIVAIGLPLAYQLLGDMFEVVEQEIVFTPQWWIYLLPPAWFAAPFEVVFNGNLKPAYIYLSILAVSSPLVGLIVYLRWISPYFERNLTRLDNSGGTKDQVLKIKAWLNKKLTSLMAADWIENIFIRFTRNMLASQRKLKLVIYPTVGMSLIFPFIFLKDQIDFSQLKTSLLQLGQGSSYLFIYVTIAFMTTIILRINQSENYKGAWIYRVLPVEKPTVIYKAAIKGFILKYNFPVFLLAGWIFLFLYQGQIMLDLVVMLLNMILLVSVFANWSDFVLPFSQEIKTSGDSSAGFIALLTAAAITGGLVAAHILLKKFVPYGLLIYVPLALIAIKLVWKKGFKCSWKEVLN